WLKRVDSLGVAAQAFHGIAHGGQVYHCGHAGKILKQDATRSEGNFALWLGLRLPVCQRLNVFGTNGLAVFRSQQVLQKDFQTTRKSCCIRKSLLDFGQAIIGEFSVTDRKLSQTAKRVCHELVPIDLFAVSRFSRFPERMNAVTTNEFCPRLIY